MANTYTQFSFSTFLSTRNMHKITSFSFVFSLFVFILVNNVALPVKALVFGIDFGSQFIKVAYVGSGKPFDVLLNDYTRRKTANAITFEPVDFSDLSHYSRLIGDEGVIKSTRLNRKSFLFPNDYLGLGPESVTSVDNLSRKESDGFLMLKQKSDYEKEQIAGINFGEEFLQVEHVYDEERGTWLFKISEDIWMFSEEITSQIFEMIRRHILKAENFPSHYAHKIACVLTVPCSATQRSRRALLYAAELAGFEVYSFTHSVLSAGVQFFLDKGIGEGKTQNILVFDVGASMVNAGVVTIRNDVANKQKQDAKVNGKSDDSNSSNQALNDKKDTNKSSLDPLKEPYATPVVELQSCISVPAAGARNIDYAIAKHFYSVIESRYPNQIPLKPHAMRKIFLSATQVKEKLSASKRTVATIENIAPNVDFFYDFSFAELESLISSKTGIFDALKFAFEEAISSSKIEHKSIDGVELIGGGWRLPIISNYLVSLTKSSALNAEPRKRLNPDEAVAMGAAFIAASLSANFRVKQLSIVDSAAHDISIYFLRLREYTSLDDDENEDVKDGNIQEAKNSDVSAEKIRLTKGIQGERTIEGIHGNSETKDADNINYEVFKVVDLLRKNSPVGGNKKVRFSTKTDIMLQILEDGKLVSQYETVGISELISKGAEEYSNYSTPKITIKLSVSKTGLVEFQNATLTMDLKPQQKIEISEDIKALDDGKIASSTAKSTMSTSTSGQSDENTRSDEGSDASKGSAKVNKDSKGVDDNMVGVEGDSISAATSHPVNQRGVDTISETEGHSSDQNADNFGKPDASVKSDDNYSDKSSESTTTTPPPRPKNISVQIKLRQKFYNPQPLTEASRKNSESKIEIFKKHDEGAKNLAFLHDELERFIYKTKDLILYSKDHVACSSEQERDNLSKKLGDYEVFLYDSMRKSESSNPVILQEILSGLTNDFQAIQSKVDEVSSRLEFFNLIENLLANSNDTFELLHINVPWGTDDILKLQDEVQGVKLWWNSVKDGGVMWDKCLNEWKWGLEEGWDKFSGIQQKLKKLKNLKKPESWKSDSVSNNPEIEKEAANNKNNIETIDEATKVDAENISKENKVEEKVSNGGGIPEKVEYPLGENSEL